MLKKQNNKKGFTLAELLIVVAIIAVLAAIAVPLFVGALENAEDRVQEANQRAVKGIAIAEILGKEEYRNIKEGNEDQKANKWTINAKVDMTGNVIEITIDAEVSSTDVKYSPGEYSKVAAQGDVPEHYAIKNMILTQFEVDNVTSSTGA